MAEVLNRLKSYFSGLFRVLSENIGTFIFLLFLTVIGVYFVRVHLSDQNEGAGTMWAIACLAAGFVTGFLFGIPRVLQSDTVVAPGGSSTEDDPVAPQDPAYRYQVNTNLEKISDWLTTIIVGLGLVQLRRVPDYFNRATGYMAYGLGGGQEKFFAGSIIIYFGILGFLSGYLVTRLYLARRFSLADQSTGLPLSSGLRMALQEVTVAIGYDPGGGTKFEGAARRAAERVAKVPLYQLSAPSDIAIWAKSQLALGNYQRAVEGYRLAVRLSPDDVQLRLDFAAALYYAGDSQARAVKELERAVDIIKAVPEIDPELKRRVYRSLTFQALYVPGWYAKTIKYAEEYVNPTEENIPSGAVYVNLASAYAQRFKDELHHAGIAYDPAQLAKLPPNLQAMRVETLTAVDGALRHDKGGRWLKRLQQLLQSNVTKSPEDDDLEVFEHDSEFRTKLRL